MVWRKAIWEDLRRGPNDAVNFRRPEQAMGGAAARPPASVAHGSAAPAQIAGGRAETAHELSSLPSDGQGRLEWRSSTQNVDSLHLAGRQAAAKAPPPSPRPASRAPRDHAQHRVPHNPTTSPRRREGFVVASGQRSCDFRRRSARRRGRVDRPRREPELHSGPGGGGHSWWCRRRRHEPPPRWAVPTKCRPAPKCGPPAVRWKLSCSAARCRGAADARDGRFSRRRDLRLRRRLVANCRSPRAALPGVALARGANAARTTLETGPLSVFCRKDHYASETLCPPPPHLRSFGTGFLHAHETVSRFCVMAVASPVCSTTVFSSSH